MPGGRKRLPGARLAAAIVGLMVAGADSVAAAAEATLYLDGIVIRLDTARWQVAANPTPFDASPVVHGVTVRCVARPDCDEHEGIWVSSVRIAVDGSGGSSDPRDDADWGYDSVSLWGDGQPPMRNFGGLEIGVYVSFSGCRAWTPPFLHASGTHAGFRYSFQSGGGFGCSQIASVPRNMFVELLSGISLIAGDEPEQ